MGWIPLGGGGDSRFEVTQIADDAAHGTLYQTNGPQAVYSPEAHRTYLAYLGLDRDLYVTYIDHHDNHSVTTPVLADTRQITATDNHSAPSICIDLDGHLHIAWGNHDGVGIRHVKSDNPHDISAWTAASLTPVTTYNFIRCDPATGNLYIFYRAGPGHGSTFPTHEYAGMIKSTNGGSSWSTQVAVIDTTGTPETHSDVYLNGVDVDSDGLFHLTWNVARGTSHDDTRTDWFHVIFDPSDDTFHTADVTDLGSVVTWAEHPDCLVANDSQVNVGDVVTDGDRAIVYWQSIVDSTSKVGIWNGSSWDVTNTGNSGMGAIYPVKDALRHVVNDEDGDNDTYIYGAPPDASYWHLIAELKAGVNPFYNQSGVLNRGPAAAFFQETVVANEPNSATAPDLVPIYMVVDEAAYEYQVAANHDHDAEYSPIGHSHGGGSSTTGTFTPTLTAATTNPTLGTGGVITGHYIKTGDLVNVWIHIVFGTSGANKGSGAYLVGNLPFTGLSSYNNFQRLGTGTARDAAPAVVNHMLAPAWNGSSRTQMLLIVQSGDVVHQDAPFSWTNNDTITLFVPYIAEP